MLRKQLVFWQKENFCRKALWSTIYAVIAFFGPFWRYFGSILRSLLAKTAKIPLLAYFRSFGCLSVPFGFWPKSLIFKSPLSFLADIFSVEIYQFLFLQCTKVNLRTAKREIEDPYDIYNFSFCNAQRLICALQKEKLKIHK